MEALHKFETTVAGWYKNVPHLPKNAQKWIADNVWWIVLIAVVLGVLGVFTGFGAIGALGAVTATYGALSPYYGVAVANVGAAITAAWIALAGLAASVVLMALAISPLKEHKKKGWDLLFLSDIVYFAIVVVSAVITYSFGNIVGALLGTAIGFYFLFEIRSHFLGHKTVKAESSKKDEIKEKK